MSDSAYLHFWSALGGTFIHYVALFHPSPPTVLKLGFMNILAMEPNSKLHFSFLKNIFTFWYNSTYFVTLL